MQEIHNYWQSSKPEPESFAWLISKQGRAKQSKARQSKAHIVENWVVILYFLELNWARTGQGQWQYVGQTLNQIIWQTFWTKSFGPKFWPKILTKVLTKFFDNISRLKSETICTPDLNWNLALKFLTKLFDGPDFGLTNWNKLLDLNLDKIFISKNLGLNYIGDTGKGHRPPKGAKGPKRGQRPSKGVKGPPAAICKK